MKILKFVLSAPLQSWGEDARWDQRTTAAMPSKSGIIGLLGCCLGVPRGHERLNQLDEGLKMAVRVDRPGSLMTDFHTVQGSGGVLFAANGKPRGNGSTIITPKQYLQDARFTVFLWGDESLLDDCFHALLHPKWPVYLGRKSCVPSVPLIPHWVQADSPEEAVSVFTEEESIRSVHKIRVEMDASSSDHLSSGQRISVRRDKLIRADQNEYGSRRIKSYVFSRGGEE